MNAHTPEVPWPRLRRLGVGLAIAATTALGVWTMFRILYVEGISPLEMAIIGLFAISDPAINPPTSPPKVHQIGRRNVTSRAGRVVSDADKPDLPLPSWMAGVQNARTSIQGSVETTGKGVKTSSWHASISAQTASGAKPTRAR